MCNFASPSGYWQHNMLRKRQYIKMLGDDIAVLIFLTLFC